MVGQLKSQLLGEVRHWRDVAKYLGYTFVDEPRKGFLLHCHEIGQGKYFFVLTE
ncbi:unannotated protein [freshwater metagenome]|uniref:Unannotated protein n=1 Tax=freshwater metagenome TaxID=449393 RepID=A0A6J6VJZ4_9ZZZZ